MRALIDDRVVPDPWRPQSGDVYERPRGEGFERLIVSDADERGYLVALLPTGEQVNIRTAWDLCAMVVCLGMLPAGRMRATEVGT